MLAGLKKVDDGLNFARALHWATNSASQETVTVLYSDLLTFVRNALGSYSDKTWELWSMWENNEAGFLLIRWDKEYMVPQIRLHITKSLEWSIFAFCNSSVPTANILSHPACAKINE